MKVFVVLSLVCVLALANAEPQHRRYKNSRYRSRVFARQEVAPVEDVAAAPYPPSGWKPDGESFELPAATSQPEQEYGPPANEYGPPDQALGQPENEYGAPENQFAPPEQLEQEDIEEDEEETATEPESETFAPLATEEESGRYRSRFVSRRRQYTQKLRALPKSYRKAPAKLRKRF